jgi:hypothetical protein
MGMADIAFRQTAVGPVGYGRLAPGTLSVEA